MKALFCIPHFFEGLPEGEARYGSEGKEKRLEKSIGLARCIANLHLLFDSTHIGVNHKLLQFEPAINECAMHIDVKVVTVPEKHLLNDLKIPPVFFDHISVQANPRHLGFEAHKHIRSAAGQYDFYGYLEDDIVIHDPHFFLKLNCFNESVMPADPKCLLQPNRYESTFRDGIVRNGDVLKIYPDYSYAEGPVNDVEHQLEFLGQTVEFEAARAPHSGCFFVNDQQLRLLFKAPNFASVDGVDEGMVLDQAATLPLHQSFHIYKTKQNCMNFFQVEHAVPGYFDLMDRQAKGEIS